MRLVDADELMKRHDENEKPVDAGECCGIMIAMDMLSSAPTVDAEQVQHGRWVADGCAFYKCSRCGCELHDADVTYYGFCPDCGARMDGV